VNQFVRNLVRRAAGEPSAPQLLPPWQPHFPPPVRLHPLPTATLLPAQAQRPRSPAPPAPGPSKRTDSPKGGTVSPPLSSSPERNGSRLEQPSTLSPSPTISTVVPASSSSRAIAEVPQPDAERTASLLERGESSGASALPVPHPVTNPPEISGTLPQPSEPDESQPTRPAVEASSLAPPPSATAALPTPRTQAVRKPANAPSASAETPVAVPNRDMATGERTNAPPATRTRVPASRLPQTQYVPSRDAPSILSPPPVQIRPAMPPPSPTLPTAREETVVSSSEASQVEVRIGAVEVQVDRPSAPPEPRPAPRPEGFDAYAALRGAT
jgi:hypothetical protein